MKINFRVIVITLSLITLVACSSDSNSSKSTTEIRMINASSENPLLVSNIYPEWTLSYPGTTPFIAVEDGRHVLEMETFIFPAPREFLHSVDMNFDANKRYSVISTSQSGQMDSLIIETSPDIADTVTRLSIAHLAPNEGLLDVYISSLSSELENVSPIETLEFKQHITFDYAPGTHRVRITLADEASLIFDTGESGIELDAGSEVLLGIIENTQTTNSGQTKAPVNLAVFYDGWTKSVFDSNDGNDIRVINASPGSSSLEFLVDSGSNNQTDIHELLAYGESSPNYVNVAGGATKIQMSEDGLETFSDFDIGNGNVITLLARNSSGDHENIRSSFEFVYETPRSNHGAVELSLVYTPTSMENVQIYLTPDGGGIDGANVRYPVESEFISFSPHYIKEGSYDLTITTQDSSTVLYTTDLDNLTAGNSYLAIINDTPTEPYNLLLVQP